MKIAIPMNESNADMQVCPSFGRAPVFLLHDTKTGKTEFHANPAADAPGGAGLKSAQYVVDRKADVLITVRCGENAAQVFRAAGVSIYKASDKTAAENLAAFEKGSLPHMTEFHAGFHGKQ